MSDQPNHPAIRLDVLEERIVGMLAETMRDYVIAAREQASECWNDKERSEGGVDALYDLAHHAGHLEELIGYAAARERASRRLREETKRHMAEAPDIIERLEAESMRQRRDLTREEFLAYAAAQAALKYGPHIIRYLDGEDVVEIA